MFLKAYDIFKYVVNFIYIYLHFISNKNNLYGLLFYHLEWQFCKIGMR